MMLDNAPVKVNPNTPTPPPQDMWGFGGDWWFIIGRYIVESWSENDAG